MALQVGNRKVQPPYKRHEVFQFLLRFREYKSILEWVKLFILLLILLILLCYYYYYANNSRGSVEHTGMGKDITINTTMTTMLLILL